MHFEEGEQESKEREQGRQDFFKYTFIPGREEHTHINNLQEKEEKKKKKENMEPKGNTCTLGAQGS